MWQTFLELDGGILLWIQEYLRSDIWTWFWKFVTVFGDAGIFWIAVCIILLIGKKTRAVGYAASFSLLLEFIVTNLVLKNLIARVRPYKVIDGLILLAAEPSDFSFPSGHAGASFAVAAAIYLAGYKKTGIAALVFATLIAFSRLYLGVHYPTDVITGTLIGCCTAFAATMILKKKGLLRQA